MIFDKVKEIIIEQLQVDESEVTLDTNLMKDLSADSLDAVDHHGHRRRVRNRNS